MRRGAALGQADDSKSQLPGLTGSQGGFIHIPQVVQFPQALLYKGEKKG